MNLTPTALARRLGIERAVIGAPMAKIAGASLAASVSNAGGLGMLGGGYGDPGWITESIAEARSLLDGDRPLGVGIITWNATDAAIEAALGAEPDAVWLSFGDPSRFAAAVREAGVPLICQVGDLADAVDALAAGADILVVQGRESGGHGRPGRSLMGMIPEVVSHARGHEREAVAVVAAGAISDRRGYDAAVSLGAAGVALGTALYATVEADDVDAAKRRLVDAHGDDTVRGVWYDLVRGPEWPSGFDGRSLRSALTDRWGTDIAGLRAHQDEWVERHRVAVETSDMTERVVWAGEGVGAIDAIVPVAEVLGRFPVVAPRE